MNNDKTRSEIARIFSIFKGSKGSIKPHFILAGPSGSGKSYTIETEANASGCDYFEINAAQITVEGISGNSLSKALSNLKNYQSKPVVCMIDEFDKLFIGGGSDQTLNVTTLGVQNELLKILEGSTTSVFGDYGKYVEVSTAKVLFVFAGAFNGTPDINSKKLRQFGVKTEFMGRVPLVYNLVKPSLDEILFILDNSTLLLKYLRLMAATVDSEKAFDDIRALVIQSYELSNIGARLVSYIVHKYFITNGTITVDEILHNLSDSADDVDDDFSDLEQPRVALAVTL